MGGREEQLRGRISEREENLRERDLRERGEEGEEEGYVSIGMVIMKKAIIIISFLEGLISIKSIRKKVSKVSE